MNILQFESYCPELAEERKIVDAYLNHFCPPGDAEVYRNYFFRLYWMASRSKAKKIVELGCRPGGSTIALMWAINRNDGHMWSCDIEGSPNELPFCPNIDLSRRTPISLTKAADLGQSWKHGQVDLIYLDTGHGYKDTCEEMEAWLPHLKEGGLFVFHDTEVYKTTVMRAIFDTMIKSSKLFEFHHFPDCHGHGVLQWYSGASTDVMRPTKNRDAISLTSLLKGN